LIASLPPVAEFVLGTRIIPGAQALDLQEPFIPKRVKRLTSLPNSWHLDAGNPLASPHLRQISLYRVGGQQTVTGVTEVWQPKLPRL